MTTLQQFLPLLNVFGKLVVPIVYLVAFTKQGWVHSQDSEWGLWEWCHSNVSEDASNLEDHVNDTTLCHTIYPGDSPCYFEFVRIFGACTLLLYILHFFVWEEKDNSVSFLSLLTAVGAGTTVTILGTCFESDSRWRDRDPSLGWCYWVALGCGVLSLAHVYVFRKYLELKTASSNVSQSPRQSQGSRPADPNPNPNPNPRTNPNPRPSRSSRPSSQRRGGPSGGASSVAVVEGSGGKSSAIFHTFPGTAHHGVAAFSSSSSNSGGGGGSSSSGSNRSGQQSAARYSAAPPGGSQLPVLQLPRYDVVVAVPGRQGEHPFSLLPPPPPSYEDVMMEEGGGSLSPPPAYTVTELDEVHREG